jgi:hypothetical protein
MGKTMGDLMGPDLGAVGNSARVSKKASAPATELKGFNVRKGDNGGVIVSESYEKKAPEGRRAASFLLGGGESKENPFGANDGEAAITHITGLLGEMGVAAAAPEPAMDEPMPPMPEEAPPPAAAAVRGPRGGGAAFKAPENLAY